MEQTIYGPKETFFGFAIDLEHGYSFPILDVGVSTSWVYDEYTGELIGIATETSYGLGLNPWDIVGEKCVNSRVNEVSWFILD